MTLKITFFEIRVIIYLHINYLQRLIKICGLKSNEKNIYIVPKFMPINREKEND